MGTTTLFNAFTAMPVLQWSHGLSAMDTRSSRTYQTSESGLQWSHGLSAMDTPGHSVTNYVLTLASMEPWPFSHGYDHKIPAGRRILKGFNGAMAFQPWIRLTCPICPSTSSPLQWSHGLSAMDTNTVAGLRVGFVSGFNGATAFQPWIPEALVSGNGQLFPSMEPRLFSHGYGRQRSQRPPGTHPPSMEPRLFSHGYYVGPVFRRSHHDPSMEPRLFSHGYAQRCRPFHRPNRAFNGATAFQPWIP